MASKIEIEVERVIKPIIDNLGYELVEVDYSKKHDGMNLTVYIYINSGITINDCEKVHLAIDPVLDEFDPTNGVSYRLNVSSLGLDRPIKTFADFNRNLNKDVIVKFYFPNDGKKEIEGKIISFTDKDFDLETKDGIIKIEIDKAAKIELKLNF